VRLRLVLSLWMRWPLCSGTYWVLACSQGSSLILPLVHGYMHPEPSHEDIQRNFLFNSAIHRDYLRVEFYLCMWLSFILIGLRCSDLLSFLPRAQGRSEDFEPLSRTEIEDLPDPCVASRNLLCVSAVSFSINYRLVAGCNIFGFL
jgi:hypothetical protein